MEQLAEIAFHGYSIIDKGDQMKTPKTLILTPISPKPYSIHTPTLKSCVGASLLVLAAVAGVVS